jgi:nucleoside-diphosphate-sugar epimerase
MTVESSILVTGASGFIGGVLCKTLKQRNISYRAVVRKKRQDADVVLANLDKSTDWNGVLRKGEVIVHLAARAHVMREKAADALEEFRKTNLHATVHLARSAASLGVKRLVYVSSIGVNGLNTIGRTAFTEADTPFPHNAYALSKWEAEQALRQIGMETGLEIVIVRPPLVYGADAPGNFALMIRVLQKQIPLPLASVENLRHLVYVENLVDALITCVAHPLAPGNTYIVSDNEAVSTPELLRRLGDAMGKPAKLFACPPGLLKLAGKITCKSNMVERLLDSLQVDNRKIQSQLGWAPPYSVYEGLKLAAGQPIYEEKK